jgi:hypothetical protein
MVTAKNSRKCSPALSPAAAMITGTGKSDEGTAGMIWAPGSFTNYIFNGCRTERTIANPE